jgi:hypothetical protein
VFSNSSELYFWNPRPKFSSPGKLFDWSWECTLRNWSPEFRIGIFDSRPNWCFVGRNILTLHVSCTSLILFSVFIRKKLISLFHQFYYLLVWFQLVYFSISFSLGFRTFGRFILRTLLYAFETETVTTTMKSIGDAVQKVEFLVIGVSFYLIFIKFPIHSYLYAFSDSRYIFIWFINLKNWDLKFYFLVNLSLFIYYSST